MARETLGLGGSFEDDDSDAVLRSRDQAAASFLLALDEVVPAARVDLAERVFPFAPHELVEVGRRRRLSDRMAAELFSRIGPSTTPEPFRARLEQLGITDYVSAAPSVEDEYSVFRPCLAELVEVLAEWAEEYRIQSRPILQLVVEVLGDWRRHGGPPATDWGNRVKYLADGGRESNEHKIDFFLSGLEPALDRPLRFEVIVDDAWDLGSETWKTAQERIMKTVKTELARFRKAAELMAAEQGLVQAPVKSATADHFKWLALYQVKDFSFGELSRRFHADRRTVLDGVRSAAELCGLTLRPPNRGGRPAE